jgi:hypothetical protein
MDEGRIWIRSILGSLAEAETCPKEPPALLRAVPETMTAFVTVLDDRYGSAEPYLAEIGVSNAEVARVRDHLLEPISVQRL